MRPVHGCIGQERYRFYSRAADRVSNRQPSAAATCARMRYHVATAGRIRRDAGYMFLSAFCGREATLLRRYARMRGVVLAGRFEACAAETASTRHGRGNINGGLWAREAFGNCVATRRRASFRTNVVFSFLQVCSFAFMLPLGNSTTLFACRCPKSVQAPLHCRL